ncbi:MAG: hypothetical protein H0T92_14505 [Pyrinomonadaceae bacterium]|nr:hypothetical protein [Pyrinomonadaceae bacterium]
MYTYVMGRLLEELKEANKITDEDLRLIAICNIIEKQIAMQDDIHVTHPMDQEDESDLNN